VSIQSDSKIKSRILLYGMVTTYQKEQRWIGMSTEESSTLCVWSCWWVTYNVLIRINGHNIVGYFIKHRDFGSHTSLFESLPLQVVYHVGYAACVMVSVWEPKSRCFIK
jgi:hypothetical protein